MFSDFNICEGCFIEWMHADECVLGLNAGITEKALMVLEFKCWTKQKW